MTNKKKAKDNSDVDVDPEIKNLKRLDRESVSIGQYRLTDPLLIATEARNTKDSPLLRLPAELRIKIYDYVLGYKHIYPNDPQSPRRDASCRPGLVCNCDGARDEKAHSRTAACFSAPLHLGLLSTCRQTHLEAFPISWSTNIFCFEDSWIMLLIFQSLAPRQKSLIQTVRLDMNHFIGDDDWAVNLKNSNLTSLHSLRKLELFFNTFVLLSPLRQPTPMPFPIIHLVDSVMRLSAPRPSFAVVSIRHGYVYHTDNLTEWMMNSILEQCVKRLQESLADEACAGEQSAKQSAVNDDGADSYPEENE